MTEVVTHSIITAIGQSPEFFCFKRKHFSVTDKVIHQINNVDGYDFEINVLHRFDSGTETEPSLGVTAPVQSTLLAVVELIIEKSNAGTLDISQATTESEFTNQFPDYVISFEGLITDSDESVWPQMVTVSDSNETAIMYFYPAYFEVQYTNSNVGVITLFDDINEFGTVNLSTVNLTVANLDELPYSSKFMEITSETPCTTQQIVMHTWVNRDNLTETMDIPFGIVCYGNPSEEVQNAAIRAYIIANSDFTSSDREVIFPTLFGNFGFTIFPYWGNVAFYDGRNIYSPIVESASMLTYIEESVVTLDPTHCANTFEIFPTVFQSLSCFVVADEEEYEQIGTLLSRIPKYILASPTSEDFVTMPADTQAFVQTLFEALDSAENYPSNNPVEGLIIELVDNLSYITFFSDGIRWRVLTKTSLLGAEESTTISEPES